MILLLFHFEHLFVIKIQLLTDHEKHIWSFDLSSYEEVQKKVSALNPHVVIGPIPQFVLKLLRQGILKKSNENKYANEIRRINLL